MSEVTYSAVGVFRRHPYWIVAFGQLAGKNTLWPKAEMRLSDQGLQKLYTVLLAARETVRTNPPKRIMLPVIRPQTWVDWQGLSVLIQKIEWAIQKLDAGESVPDSEQFHAGGSLN